MPVVTTYLRWTALRKLREKAEKEGKTMYKVMQEIVLKALEKTEDEQEPQNTKMRRTY